MKSASEPSSLREILSIEFKMQGSTKPAFNSQIQTQADKAKTQRSSNLRLAYQYKSRVWKSNTGMSLALAVHIQKRLKSTLQASSMAEIR